MAEQTGAEKIAAAWTTRKQRVEAEDVADLPNNLAEAILAVEKASWDMQENVRFAEQAWEEHPEHPLALEPNEHQQTTWAQRYEVVDGGVIEITKTEATSPITLTYRPELRVGGAADPLSALEARLQVPAEPEPEPEEGDE